MGFNNEVSFLSVGSSHCCAFQTIGTANPETCADSASGDLPIGVAQENCFGTPGLPGTDNTLATNAAGQMLRVYQEGEDCLIQVSAAVTQGDLLMPDGSGNGYAITATSGHYYGAQALQSASGTGVKIRCVVLRGWKN